MKQFVSAWLAKLARAVIQKHKPIIIGITGSVGKTSARDAIYAVVSAKYSARKPKKNFNNEVGLPLAVLGEDSPGTDPIGWTLIFIHGLKVLLFGPFPKVLVLEMGIDRPGDMDYLLSIAKPHISVVTNIGISHYEFFKSMATVAKEKGKIVEVLGTGDIAVLDADNAMALAQRDKAAGKVLTYGLAKNADVRYEIRDEVLTIPPRTDFLVEYQGVREKLSIPVVGKPYILAASAGVAVGVALEMKTHDIKEGLSKFQPVPGRMNLIAGIKSCVLIDDTYNSAPDSAEEALKVLQRHPYAHKIAVLGDMLELGDESLEAHRRIGKLVAEIKPNQLITVGSYSRILAQAARDGGMSSHDVHSFDDSTAAASYLLKVLPSNSAVLIKGSQGVRLEKITKELMREPMRAPDLLCRQYGRWLNS